MANDVTLTATGDVIATEELSSREYQLIKVMHGAEGAVNYASDATPLPVKAVSSGAVTHVWRYLDTDGDGSGTKNANGNYSGAVEEFYIEPASDEVMLIHRMLVSVEDTSGMSENEYGNLGSALSNGIEIKKIRGTSTVIEDLTDGVPITINAHWTRESYDKQFLSTGSGNDTMAVRWTFAASGAPIRLDGALGDRLVVFLNDDLTGLVAHYFKVQGVYE